MRYKQFGQLQFNQVVYWSLGLLFALATGFAQAQSIDGGLTWNGWTSKGFSNQAGVYGSGSTTDAYQIYTTNFVFNNHAKATGTVGGGATGGTSGFGTGTYSSTAFSTGNFILGIGLSGANVTTPNTGWITVKFDLDGDSYRAASTVGGTDGRTSFDAYSEAKDYTIQFTSKTSSLSWTGQTINVQSGNGTFYGGTSVPQTIPGGSVGYDFPFRIFTPSSESGSLQMFFDITALQSIYGGSRPGFIGIGDMGPSVNFALQGGYSDNQVAMATAVPEPSTLSLLGVGLTGLVFRRRRA